MKIHELTCNHFMMIVNLKTETPNCLTLRPTEVNHYEKKDVSCLLSSLESCWAGLFSCIMKCQDSRS